MAPGYFPGISGRTPLFYRARRLLRRRATVSRVCQAVKDEFEWWNHPVPR